MVETVRLERIDRAGRQLALRFALDGQRFSASYWYDIDLDALDSRYGAEAMERLWFHVAAFELNKLCSLAPAVVDFGRYARFATARFMDLWREVFRRVWAQWRYENNRPDYAGPAFASPPAEAAAEPLVLEPGEVDVLAFCGGGKDSLVMLGLLERAGVAYASLAYATSSYGRSAPQHALIDRLLDARAPARRHKQWVFDDFMEAPVLPLAPGVTSLAAAETPGSVFGALPLALAGGYRTLALAHEASANAGNLVWSATGEEINHQWGKSREAERLLNAYIREELVAGTAYVGLLQPIHDPVIFALLREDLDDVPLAHSCNERKPWCSRCPKCAYVYLGYAAYLPPEVTARVFSENLLDVPANQGHYRQMLGLAEHTPFECIGQIDETRLAFELCRRRGITGAAVDLYAAEVAPIDVHAIAARYLEVDDTLDTLPPALATAILPQMRAAAARARDLL